MSTETIILFAVILVLVDLFLPTDLPTLIAYGLFSYVISRQATDNILYQLILGILCWWGMAFFHFLIWKKFIKKVTDRFISPTKLKSGINAYSGKEATICNVEGSFFVKIEDELYPFMEETNMSCSSGDKVTIITYADERMLVKLKE